MVQDPRHAVTAERVWRRQNVVIIVLSIFVIFSALASAWTLATVYQTRRLLRAQL